ncbi:glutathione S-transferase family protein [Endothiovibrio diazotrophicus]
MNDLTLYDYPLSGNCYKVRLFLALLGLEYRRVPIDILAGKSQTPEFRRLNPRGQIPLLEVGEARIWDSQAILVYLARRFGEERWLPREPLAEARVMQWLAVAENELLYGLARARAVRRLNRPFDLTQCQEEGRAGLAVLESRLAAAQWLAGEGATIADVACYPYVLLAHEGEVSLEPYPGVRRWLERVAALPGWVAMG